MKNKYATLVICSVFWCGLVLGANDLVVHPTGVTGHDGGNWPSTLGHLTDMLNATDIGFLTGDHDPDMDTSADTSQGTNNPAVWTFNNGGWNSEYLANSRLDSGTSLNSKIGWVVVDFGSVIERLSNMYMWDGLNCGATEKTEDFNVYYSSGVGIDALPAMPNSKTTRGDYDFSSGDWTKLNTSGVLTMVRASGYGETPNLTVSLEQVSARYIGIEILTASGVANRNGFGQIEFTLTPPPAGTVFTFQ